MLGVAWWPMHPGILIFWRKVKLNEAPKKNIKSWENEVLQHGSLHYIKKSITHTPRNVFMTMAKWTHKRRTKDETGPRQPRRRHGINLVSTRSTSIGEKRRRSFTCVQHCHQAIFPTNHERHRSWKSWPKSQRFTRNKREAFLAK